MNFKTTGRIIRKPTEQALPSKPQLAKNASKALVRNVAALLSGKQVIAGPEEEQRRHSICKPCEFFRASDDRCAHKNCGCKLKFKTRLKAEHCPAGKW